MPRPGNIFLLSADALRADHAIELATTVAERTGGTRFTNAVAPASHTASSIPALATGQFIDEEGTIKESLLPSSFAANGYHTHLLTDNPLAADSLTEQSSEKTGGLNNLLDDLLPRGLTRPVEQAYFRQIWPTMRRLGLATPYYRPATQLQEQTLDALSHVTDPIFCWLHYMDTHSPYYVPSDHEVTTELDRHQAAAMSRSVGIGDTTATDPDAVETITRLYRAASEYLGDSIIEFIDEIREQGLYRPDRDVLAVTADHGECLDPKRGMFGHLPPASWESLIHVPLVVARPDWPETTVDEQVSLIDLPEMLRTAVGEAVSPSGFGREYVATVAGTLTAAGIVRGIRRGDGEKLFGRRTADGTDVVHTHYEVGDPAAETVRERRHSEAPLAPSMPTDLVDQAAELGGLVGENQYLSGIDESQLRALGYLE